MQQLVEALQANFNGYESLRQTLLNKAPKYGNDDPYADEIAREVSHFWTEEASRHLSPTGKRYRGDYFSWNYWIAYAPFTAATCIQLNVIDANTLREAQKHPDDHRNLLVRVTGYNAYFVGLGKEIQDEIMARESHRLG
jgi:pyruvate-formate lyase